MKKSNKLLENSRTTENGFESLGAFRYSLWALVQRYGHFLVKLVWNTEGGSFWSSCQVLCLIKIGSWRRVFFHISLHPFRELPFISKPKPDTFGRIWLEAGINIVTGFPTVFGSRHESGSFGHAEDENRLLKGGRALLIKNFVTEIFWNISDIWQSQRRLSWKALVDRFGHTAVWTVTIQWFFVTLLLCQLCQFLPYTFSNFFVRWLCFLFSIGLLSFSLGSRIL